MLRVCVLFLLVQQLYSLGWWTDKHKSSTTTEDSLQGVNDVDVADWQLWKSVHNKLYRSSEEERDRYSIWRSNKAFIEAHNNNSAEFGYTVRMNQFGDLVRLHNAHERSNE